MQIADLREETPSQVKSKLLMTHQKADSKVDEKMWKKKKKKTQRKKKKGKKEKEENKNGEDVAWDEGGWDKKDQLHFEMYAEGNFVCQGGKRGKGHGMRHRKRPSLSFAYTGLKTFPACSIIILNM